jgi:stearoyl-CoA desaturase (delta-9 desaturase)
MVVMWSTKTCYFNLLAHRVEPEPGFDKNIPEWPVSDIVAGSWISRLLWAGFCTFYIVFATRPWMFLLLPIHFFMGPIQGGIVDWCGHKCGYRNFEDTDDRSMNSLRFNFVAMGELFSEQPPQTPESAQFCGTQARS